MYNLLTAVILTMLFSWIASWNAAVRSRMAWLVGGGRDWKGLWAMVAVKGHIQVADVVDWCVADHTSLL